MRLDEGETKLLDAWLEARLASRDLRSLSNLIASFPPDVDATVMRDELEQALHVVAVICSRCAAAMHQGTGWTGFLKQFPARSEN